MRLLAGMHHMSSGVVDGKHTAGAGNFAGKTRRIIKARHLGFQDRSIEHPHNFQVEEVSEGPSSVIVWMLLWIGSGPELTIEQGIGDARVGLIHADDDAASWERALRF